MGPRTMQRAMIEGFLFGRQSEARIAGISDPETGAVLQHDDPSWMPPSDVTRCRIQEAEFRKVGPVIAAITG